jgi:2-dehydro-3-deoxygalactonokinase
MPRARFVAGDWGTTNLRLFLCDEAGRVIEELAGPGAANTTGRFPAVFEQLTAPWRQRFGALPAVLSGMVGSTIGWVTVPYVPCPAEPAAIAGACASPNDGRVLIVPGLSCRNRFDAPDVMRGEETQILGALELHPALRTGRQTVCLPGTHTKWVVLEDGAVTEFVTAPTGELFALLRERSVLVHAAAAAATTPGDAAFIRALDEFERFPHAQLLHRLFECRARRLAGELADADSAAYLSGLLLASDVHGALAAPGAVNGAVHLIGAAPLTALYAAALTRRNRSGLSIDGGAAALAGLTQVFRSLPVRMLAHGG